LLVYEVIFQVAKVVRAKFLPSLAIYNHEQRQHIRPLNDNGGCGILEGSTILKLASRSVIPRLEAIQMSLLASETL
jgi:hypothetical protein